MFYVYLLKSKRNPSKLYIGSTKSLIKRLNEHNSGKGGYTSKYAPWKVIYYEGYILESSARTREKRLKNNGNALIQLKNRINYKDI